MSAPFVRRRLAEIARRAIDKGEVVLGNLNLPPDRQAIGEAIRNGISGRTALILSRFG